MSAEVSEAVGIWLWRCEVCPSRSWRVWRTEAEAVEDAANHDTRWHEPAERDYDADRKHEREERIRG